MRDVEEEDPHEALRFMKNAAKHWSRRAAAMHAATARG
jgi:hypothetical protein